MMRSFPKNVLMRRGLTILFAATALSSGLPSLQVSAATASQNAGADLVYVGMDGGQLGAMRFDAGTGKLVRIGVLAEVPKPRWAVAHPQLPMLYVSSDGNTKDGSVIAFLVDRETGALTRVGEVSAGGAGTTHLWLDMPSMTLLAANFGGGSTSSIVLMRDGSLGPLVSTIKATGSGPHRRQASPHAHGVAVDPSGRYVLVSDLGADRLFVYGFDRRTHVLSPDDKANPKSFVSSAGSGPRHFVFGLNGNFVYLLNELAAELMALRWDAQQGRLTPVQSVPASSPEFKGAKSAAGIAISLDGRFVYVADRGEQTLVVYRVNPDSGELSLVQRTSSGGEIPWAFAIHPSGKWMLVANQRSGKVNVFSINPESGLLSDTGQSADAPAPLSITFVSGE
ncbi:MAG: lactonase family protein [Pseudomonadota bacterium]